MSEPGILSELIRKNAESHGEREFLLFERQPKAGGAQHGWRQSLSFAELDARVDRACHYLTELGLKRGDIFNLHLPNCPTFILLWLAGARLGAVEPA